MPVKRMQKKCWISRTTSRQYEMHVRWFYSENCRRLYETPFCSKSQIHGQGKDKTPVKRIQYQFHPETEAALNQQLNVELKASYYYLSMALYFGQVNVALPGCESYFMHMHQEEYGHAVKLLNYTKTRGGRISLCVINPPDEQNWLNPLHAFQTALDLEISVADDLIAVHGIAEKHCDISVTDFIITNFIDDQMKSISEIARFVTILSGIGNEALGQFIFDRDLLKHYVPQDFNVLRKT
ncbi:soma ferritin [Fopius arisanus]|uniref:Ferritin n=2 Tax=Fopius arisanus TaxID=64838 RepID=A0A9R1TAW4_9HYME|nr:PREDICTED: soma ferritin-like [Fopius arisanus]